MKVGERKWNLTSDTVLGEQKDIEKKEIALNFQELDEIEVTANISESNESRIPHFSKFHLRLLKLSIREKIPDRPLKKPLKLIQAISK